MADHLESVKTLARNYGAMSNTADERNDAAVAARHARTADALRAIIQELEQLRLVTQPIPASYGDLSDLPPSLMKELSGTKADELEQQLFTIIKSGAEVELDAILIELWRRFKVEQTRKFLQNKLWRMAQKGMIWTIPGKKGVYTASEPPKAIKRVAQPAAFDADLDDDVPF